MIQDAVFKLGEIRTPDDLSGKKTTQLVQIARTHADAEVLKSLAGHDNVVVRIAVANNPHISPAVVAILQERLDERITRALDGNDAVSADVVDLLRSRIREGVFGE